MKSWEIIVDDNGKAQIFRSGNHHDQTYRYTDSEIKTLTTILDKDIHAMNCEGRGLIKTPND